jgi:sulfite dehydrogenase (cytochrome) subunit B
MQSLRILAALLIVGVGILVYAVWGGPGRQPNSASAPVSLPVPVAELTARQPVKEISVEYHTPDMPPGPGREPFATQCVICHSPRYILNQPIFPRKTWTAEVLKMVKVYGASITPNDQKQIVDYLVYWHGREDAAPHPAPNTASTNK